VHQLNPELAYTTAEESMDALTLDKTLMVEEEVT
jgi:hypothetical protein